MTFDDGYADVLSAARPVLDIAGHPHGWRTGGKLATDEGRDGPIVVREQLHDELWRLLRPLDPESRSDLIIRLCAWVGAEVGTKSMNRPLSAEEVHRLAAPGFNDIGAHTVTHPQLSLLDDAGQRGEIEGSRRACEELVGRPIDTFAYPFGDFNDSAAASVHECGFACACTASGGAVARRIHRMRLPRFGVGNWRGDDLARRLTAHS